MEKVQVLDKQFEFYLSYEEIDSKIQLLANKINKDLAGKDPIFICILNGAFMFAADLLKKLTIDCSISFLKMASYSGVGSTGTVKQLIGLNENISSRTVVIVEDIIDTGLTIENIIKQLNAFDPKEILIASLIVKPDSYNGVYPIDYYCFQIPNDFIVGYGLDYNGYGRNLKNIYQICK